MKLPIKERAFTTGMIIVATIVVIVLGALQYRWSNQISEATSTRLADSLQMSMVNWHLDLFRDFSEICLAIREDPEVNARGDWNQYARRYAEWKSATVHPQLISSLYLLGVDPAGDSRVLRLNPARLNFETVSPPATLAALRENLKDEPEHLATAADRFFSGGPLAGWKFEPTIPALVRRVSRLESSGYPSTANQPSAQWMVIFLDESSVRDQILPELAQRYFRGTEGLDYQVAVVAGNQTEHVLYSSDPPFGATKVADADGTMNIFGRTQDEAMGSPIHIFHAPSGESRLASPAGITWFPLIQEPGAGQDWRLVLRHRRGGALGAFVADSRRRDLAISFGVLFLLVISIAILVITSTRAQRLAKLQMDFVTAVSHELRTPLTVISSAAENIEHGVVDGKEQLKQYGTVIGSQARKLFEMVEQILLFASIREGHQRYSLQPLNVSDVVESALTGTAELIHAADFQVDRTVEPNLPQILGDLSALSQCLQNLITNALKYGSERRWMGIQASLIEHGPRGREVQIVVLDRGIGIDKEELPHIFEPFFRSSSVTTAQIHGTGLGLPLAKSIVEAMKGQLSVKSVPGRGSSFTLHLPCLEHPLKEAGMKSTATMTS